MISDEAHRTAVPQLQAMECNILRKVICFPDDERGGKVTGKALGAVSGHFPFHPQDAGRLPE